MEPKSIILDKVYNYPMQQLKARELSRDTRLNTKTVMKYLDLLTKEGLICRNKTKGHYPYYEANRLSKLYRFEKSRTIISSILVSGLVEFLEKQTSATAIVLFGSAAKGTYSKESDIDIFINAAKKDLTLFVYEKRLDRKINILFERFSENLTKGILTNILNGYVLSGKLELFLYEQKNAIQGTQEF